jgi:NADH-quinone oxidoreductase subunit L
MIAFWLGIAAAFMTAFYSCRLMFMTFHGEARWAKAHDHGHGHDAQGHDDHGHGHHEPHEAPSVMLVPLYVLALGALIAGGVAYNFFVGEGMEKFWRGSVLIINEHHALHDAHHAPLWVKALPLVMALAGIALAYRFYVQKPGLPSETAASFPGLYKFSFNKWYFDELYDFLFVRPAMWLGRQLWKKGDVGIIDEVGPNGLARGATKLAGVLGRAQSGYLYHYAFAMLIGVAALVTWYLLSRGH